MELPLPARLAARKDELGHNWSDVARAVNANESLVSRWRRGSVPSAQYLPAIARYLDVPEEVVWRSLPETMRVRQRMTIAAAENPLLTERIADLERIVGNLSAQAEGGNTGEAEKMRGMLDEANRTLVAATELIEEVRLLRASLPVPPGGSASRLPPTAPRQKG